MDVKNKSPAKKPFIENEILIQPKEGKVDKYKHSIFIYKSV